MAARVSLIRIFWCTGVSCDWSLARQVFVIVIGTKVFSGTGAGSVYTDGRKLQLCRLLRLFTQSNVNVAVDLSCAINRPSKAQGSICPARSSHFKIPGGTAEFLPNAKQPCRQITSPARVYHSHCRWFGLYIRNV